MPNKHYSRPWVFSSDQNRYGTSSEEAYYLVGETNKETNIHKITLL